MPGFSPFWSDLYKKQGQPAPRIAFADALDPRVLEASRLLSVQGVEPVLVMHEEMNGPEVSRLADLLAGQKKANLTPDSAREKLKDSIYLGLALLLDKKIDALIAGSLRPTADVVRAALQCLGTRESYRLVAGHFLFESTDHPTADATPFLLADCAVMPEPSSRSLAAIAVGAAESFQFFTGKTPRIALLSFSTRGSAEHPLVDRIREALTLIQKQRPDLIVDGELQADAALDPQVALIKGAGDSAVAGKSNVFIFPNLESGNIGYKLVQRFTASRVAGPILWGLEKPVSDLSRGCTVQEIMDTAMCVANMVRRPL